MQVYKGVDSLVYRVMFVSVIMQYIVCEIHTL